MNPMNPFEDPTEEIDPLTGQRLMPNTPRDPEDPREKLRSYLAAKMESEKKMLTPEYRQAMRAPMDTLQDSQRDLAFQNLLSNASAQLGTVGGKAAPNTGMNEYTKQLQGLNQQTMQGIEKERADIEGMEDRRGKMLQYLADKFDSKEAALAKGKRDEEMMDLRRRSVAAQEKAAGGKEGDKVIDRTLKLQKDYGDEENIKRLNNYRDTLTNAEKLAANPSPVNDTSLLYQYVRSNDPTTGVKDMELAIASRSGAVWDRIKGYVEGMESGMMTPQKRQQLLENMRAQASAAEERALETEATYETLSRTAGADPNIVIGQRRSKAKRPETMITVSNGTETYDIPASDLADAERDGFKKVGGQ